MSDTQDEKLTSKDKIDYLFDVLDRFDFYINSSNTKASIILAWNGIVIGTVLLKYEEITRLFQGMSWAKNLSVIMLVLIGLSGVISNIFVFSVVFPFLKPTSKQSKRGVLETESMLFFGSVAAIGGEAYLKQIINTDADQMLADLTDQAATIAQALQSKMQLIRKGLITVGVGMLFISGLLILKAAVV
jgi:hypothetical protein